MHVASVEEHEVVREVQRILLCVQRLRSCLAVACPDFKL